MLIGWLSQRIKFVFETRHPMKGHIESTDLEVIFEYKSNIITVKSTPLTISRDEPIVHMAAIMPNAENRDKFILIEKCWTDQQVLLQDFGCSKSELRKVITSNLTQTHNSST